MKLYTLKRQQLVRKPLPEVFSFFSRPENLETLTPKNLGFQILTPSPITMKEGTVIDYVIRFAGFPVRWTTLISLYDPPRTFVDVQSRGPYSFWHHTHAFTELHGGTLIEDEVRYALPFGIIGRILHALIIRRRLEQIFRYRAQIIERLFSDERISTNQSIMRNHEKETA